MAIDLLTQQFSATHGQQLVVGHLLGHLNACHLLNHLAQYCQVIADDDTTPSPLNTPLVNHCYGEML